MLSFTRCISAPWIFSFSIFSSVFNLYSHLSDPIRSWGSDVLFLYLWRFWRRIRSGQQICLLFLREVDWFPSDILRVIYSFCWVWYSRGYPLCSSRQVFDLPTAHLVALLVGSWSQTSPWFSGFSEVLGRTASQFPGSFLPALCCYRIEIEKVLSEFFPSLQRSHYKARWREGKNPDNNFSISIR